MKCFDGCFGNSNAFNNITNRTTGAPIKFTINELEQLRKKFIKVSGYRQDITSEFFKRNLGILGLKCAEQFSERLFNAFDLDNDSKISFQDFIEYMQILKCGSDKNKARISFKLIAPKNSNRISQLNFMEFLNDFFLSWSSITNISITAEIKERTSQYVGLLFKKVRQETGKGEIDLKYYVDNLYKDREYMESFEFITQGMADIFIHDKMYYEHNPEAMLFRIVKEIREINDTILQMNNEQSIFYQPIKIEESVRRLPEDSFSLFNRPLPKRSPHKSSARSNDLPSKPSKFAQTENQRPIYPPKDSEDTFERTKINNSPQSSMNHSAKQLNDTSLLISLQKKFSFIRQKLQGIVQQTRTIYESLRQKFQSSQDNIKQSKFETVKNVHKRAHKNEGNMIFIGDDNWNLVLNMMIGIQMAVRSVRGFQEMIYEEPKDFGLKYYFELIPRRFGDQEYTSTIYSFTDYAPNTFNHIRKLFKIDNEQYIGSIGPNRLMASLMMGEVNSMTSLTSQGKSGSFFYYTADGKYMLKTMSQREYKLLKNILEDYYYHLKKNPESMIIKFYGLHKLIEKNEKGDEINRSYFVIMANVFNTKEKIVERYDLKGSWVGRTTNDTDPSATKKDNDFKKRPPIYLQESQRTKLLQIIRKDAEFFQKHEIIDYSLLIGVIRKNDDRSQFQDGSRIIKEEAEISHCRQSKVFISAAMEDNIESYIFGIIDILTPYDSRKMVEYFFKNIIYGQGISAVPPKEYSSRFYQFFEKTVFPPLPLSITSIRKHM